MAGIFEPIKQTYGTDLSTSEGLGNFAASQGYGQEVEKIIDEGKNLSFLQRLGKGLGAFNPAEAILTGVQKGFGSGLKEYGLNVAQGIGSAVTGTDYEGERRGFKDVAKKLGVKNKIAQFGIGFLGDVLLDPSTYFGGALVRASVGLKLWDFPVFLKWSIIRNGRTEEMLDKP
jgi:hypothetical protein